MKPNFVHRQEQDDRRQKKVNEGISLNMKNITEVGRKLSGLEPRREKPRALKQAMMQELLTGRTRLIN